MTAERQYDAFGNVIASSGAWTSQFGNAGRFGYQEDPDYGLKLLGHRYYDSSTGRFLTRDKIKFDSNWYAYCGNNPVTQQDANGFFWETLLDLVSLALTVKDYLDNPSAESAAWIAADLAAVLLPIPSSGIIRHGRKFLRPAEDSVKTGKLIGKLDGTPASEKRVGSSAGPGAGKPFPKKTKDEVKAEDRKKNNGKNKCAYCGREPDYIEIDHIIPKSKGNGTAPKSRPDGEPPIYPM